MGTLDKHSLVKYVEDGLNRELKDALKHTIMKQQIDEFKEKIKPIIEKHVDKIIIDGVECIRDMESFRDELQVYIKWNN